jgi:hypothetical protein
LQKRLRESTRNSIEPGSIRIVEPAAKERR